MITILGRPGLQGLYLLRIALSAPLAVAFGRFARGRELSLPAGDYLYVGSAMGQRGATTLAGRLLRHATRSADQPPHAIRSSLFDKLEGVAMLPQLPLQKRCHWHIDYLLDQRLATLSQIIALRTNISLETTVARWLMAEAVTAILAPGLGASDDRGATHLLQVTAPPTWWQALPTNLADFALNHKVA